MWSETQEFPSLQQPIFFQKSIQPLVDQVVEPISPLVNPTLPSESDFHEAIELIPLSINPVLPLEIEVFASHIFFTSSSELTK